MTTQETESGSRSPHFGAECFADFFCKPLQQQLQKLHKSHQTENDQTAEHTHACTLVVWNQALQKHFKDLKSVHCVSYRPRPWRCSLLVACRRSQSLSCFPPPSTLHSLSPSHSLSFWYSVSSSSTSSSAATSSSCF